MWHFIRSQSKLVRFKNLLMIVWSSALVHSTSKVWISPLMNLGGGRKCLKGTVVKFTKYVQWEIRGENVFSWFPLKWSCSFPVPLLSATAESLSNFTTARSSSEIFFFHTFRWIMLLDSNKKITIFWIITV